MTISNLPDDYSIGWDVGGWNCDDNIKSRDAIVILNDTLQIVGQPWRGNLRTHINEAKTALDWVSGLFALCKIPLTNNNVRITLAIDTPLGFPTDFLNLVTALKPLNEIGLSGTNQYLYRKTERELFRRGSQPLSVIKDMIGSQATKGVHVLAKFAHQTKRCGVWTDGDLLAVIETYPARCKASACVTKLRAKIKHEQLTDNDRKDALTCALVAHLFRVKPEMLVLPTNDVPINEGWIWLPSDAPNGYVN